MQSALLCQSHAAKFYQPQNVSVDNSHFYEIRGDQHVYYNGNLGPLERLASYGMLDATFDSSARDPPPRCHPGTRKGILRSIQSKLQESDTKAHMRWLRGAAGVGKSAIMQTLAEAEAQKTLGASLFFSRPNNRNDPRKVFTTIAYQLAVKNPSYEKYILQRIITDPTFLGKSMEKQFNDLIVIPIAEKCLFPDRALVILLDGLDECQDEREQCRIINLIDDFVTRHPNIPLTWIMASRPEAHLKTAFLRVKSRSPSFFEQDIPIDSDEAVQDVEQYLYAEFTRIQETYPDIIPSDSRWPSEGDFLALSSAASGLFVFASTLIRFIDDPCYGNPVSRLNHIISILSKQLEEMDTENNPFKALDLLYDAIMSEIPQDVLPTTKRLLGYISIDYDVGLQTMSTLLTCNFLGLERHVFYGSVRKLHSVLEFPEPRNTRSEPIRFLHASFAEYLRNPKRSNIYSIDLDDVVAYVWCRSMTILQQWMKTNAYGNNIVLCWEDKGVGDSDLALFLRRDMVSISGPSWIRILEDYFGNGGQDEDDVCSIPLLAVVGQLHMLDYSRWQIFGTLEMAQICFSSFEWQGANAPLQGISQILPLTALDKKRLLTSVYQRRWFFDSTQAGCHTSFDLQVCANEENIYCEENLEDIEQMLRDCIEGLSSFLDLLEDPKVYSMTIRILGAHPSRCCAWVEDAGDSLDKMYEKMGYPIRRRTRHCYIFPYITL